MPRTARFLFPVLLALLGCNPPTKEAPSRPARTTLLAARVRAQQQASEAACAAYVPKVPGSIDVLDAPTADMLRHLPGVVDVEVLVAADQPTHRIIHLADWHFVPRDLYALDLSSAAGRPLADAEVERRWQEHLLEVELVQLEQTALLRCLVQHHGLRRLHSEGLTPRGVEAYKRRLTTLKKLGDQLAALDAEMQLLPADKRATVQPAFDELAREQRLGLLELGAPGRLALAGEVEVLPLDDDPILDAARPVSRRGKVGFDPQAVEARHDGQVQAVLSSAPCSLIVLGGKHDLSASLRRVKGQRVEYIRVRTRGYNEVAAPHDESGR